MDRTIYIIDDDRDLLAILNFFFRKEGYKVITDYNGNKFDIAMKPCPDLYLIDINLIDKNGFDICKMIKKECSQARVVLMSANTNLEIMASECNADGFIRKPFGIESLYEIIDAVIA